MIGTVFEENKLSILLKSEAKTTEYSFETDAYGVNKENIACKVNVFEVKAKKTEIMFAPVKKDFNRMPNTFISFKLYPNFPEQDELNSVARFIPPTELTPTPKTNIAETYFLSYIVDDCWTLTVYHTPKPNQPQEKLLEEKLKVNGILRIFYNIFYADLGT
ncbi:MULTISPECIES: hypothetical protein [unclassified Serratia (in: enterobacteria)]|uniref:hypothetical protein n=1 Tax=unclassified Serratia (in: enterobacteria) TaxID=2647522 RepID=UPI0030763028